MNSPASPDYICPAGLAQLRLEVEQLRAENAKLREAAESAHAALHKCVRDRWDEAHVENAYFTLGAAL